MKGRGIAFNSKWPWIYAVEAQYRNNGHCNMSPLTPQFESNLSAGLSNIFEKRPSNLLSTSKFLKIVMPWNNRWNFKTLTARVQHKHNLRGVELYSTWVHASKIACSRKCKEWYRIYTFQISFKAKANLLFTMHLQAIQKSQSS